MKEFIVNLARNSWWIFFILLAIWVTGNLPDHVFFPAVFVLVVIDLIWDDTLPSWIKVDHPDCKTVEDLKKKLGAK